MLWHRRANSSGSWLPEDKKKSLYVAWKRILLWLLAASLPTKLKSILKASGASPPSQTCLHATPLIDITSSLSSILFWRLLYCWSGENIIQWPGKNNLIIARWNLLSPLAFAKIVMQEISSFLSWSE